MSSQNLDALLEKKNIIIYFFMIGCPYCEKTTPIWNEFKSKQKGFEFAEIESADIPSNKKDELGIQGYPHFVKIDSKGKRKKVSGSKSSLEELSGALLGKAGGSRRRISRKFRNRIRKTRRFRRT